MAGFPRFAGILPAWRQACIHRLCGATDEQATKNAPILAKAGAKGLPFGHNGRALCRALHWHCQRNMPMDTKPVPFVPPAPKPRTQPPSTLEMMRIVYRNPLELWGEHTYNEPWISVTGIGGPLVIANDPGLIRHVLIDNAKNYKMATVRQLILRPILRDGLLTAEGEVWKRSRRAIAPVFTPRHIFGFAEPMLKRTLEFVTRYEAGGMTDVAHDMTLLTF